MKKLLRVALVGSAGRMGQTVAFVAGSESVEIVRRMDQGDKIDFRGADAVIDFSDPDVAEPICEAALQEHTPLVIGTTGHSIEQIRTIEAAAKKLPVVLAANFSVGVNALFWLAEHAGGILGDDFDLEIVEMHHRLKKDAPSGTAKTLAKILQQMRHRSELRHGREGMCGERNRSEIGIHALRGGDVIGDHTVIFAGDGERIELTHRAGSREAFARGALRAARWIIGKGPDLYSMRDVLELR